MVADRWNREKNFQNREKTLVVEKNLPNSRKKKLNPKKYFRVKKKKKKEKKDEKIKYRKNQWKIFQNRENYFTESSKLLKNVSESRNFLSQESRKNLEFNDLEFNEPPSWHLVV